MDSFKTKNKNIKPQKLLLNIFEILLWLLSHFSFLFDNNLFNSKVKKVSFLGLQEVEWFKSNWPPFWKAFSIIVLNYPAVLENNAELLNEV